MIHTNVKRIFACIAILSLVALAGCGGGEEQAQTQAQTKYVVAADCSWPPMEFVNKENKIVGFDIDLMQAMSKAGNFEVEVVNTAWDGIFGGLIAGKYDCVMSSVSITDERKNTMDFSAPYFEVKQGIVVQQSSGIESEADLAGKIIAAQIGTTGYFVAQKMENIAEARSYDDVGLAIEDLYNGRVDAVACDDAVAYDYALQNEKYAAKLDMPFVVASDKKEFLGIAVQKGNAELVGMFNDALKKVKDSGEYDEIYSKWFK